MKQTTRKEFLKGMLLGVGALVVAPKTIADECITIGEHSEPADSHIIWFKSKSNKPWKECSSIEILQRIDIMLKSIREATGNRFDPLRSSFILDIGALDLTAHKNPQGIPIEDYLLNLFDNCQIKRHPVGEGVSVQCKSIVPSEDPLKPIRVCAYM